MIPEAPEITKKTKLLCLDVESNGLHGEAFAVGAVLIDCTGKILDEYSGRCPLKGEVDEWVQKNVLPVLRDMPEDHKTPKALRKSFWEWYKKAKEESDYVVVNNGYPVETRFLAACQDDDLEARYWDHPFPLLDLSSMLLQVNVKPLAVRHQVVEDELEGQVLQHHPRWDAWVSALVAIKALKLSGRLK